MRPRPVWFDEGPPRAVRKGTPYPFHTHRTMAEAMRDEEGMLCRRCRATLDLQDRNRGLRLCMPCRVGDAA